MRARWTMTTPASYVVAADRKNLLSPAPAHWFNPFFWGQGNVMIACGKSLTRVDLYDAVYRKVGLSRAESTSFV